MTGRYQKLFLPIDIGNLTLPNRIMRTSMVSGLSTEDGYVTDALIARYQRETKGGIGSIVVEAAVIQPSRSNYNLRISDDTFMTNLNKLLATIRKVNSEVKIGIQLVHFLKISRSGWRQKVEDFTKDDLSILIQQHTDAAIRAKSIGFDFIELHMAHAYTLSSFLSLSNKREDEYGSNLEGRLKLPIEVYNSVRDTVGAKYAIGIRINGEDFTIPGNTLLQSTKISYRFAELGVNYISVSTGSRYEDACIPPSDTPPNPMSGYSGHRMSPGWWFPDGTHAYLADSIRKYIRGYGFNTPIIIAGKIRTPKLADEILQNDNADIIGLCRAILCDPDWPIKARDGNENQIVKCTACNWCLEADSRMEKVNCSRWPQNAIFAPEPFLPKVARASTLSNTIPDI
jgi:2,4-dienoyl-CoA reductase-like NADH-dependent reductase (Old Yellow Enzyme family)